MLSRIDEVNIGSVFKPVTFNGLLREPDAFQVTTTMPRRNVEGRTWQVIGIWRAEPIQTAIESIFIFI